MQSARVSALILPSTTISCHLAIDYAVMNPLVPHGLYENVEDPWWKKTMWKMKAKNLQYRQFIRVRLIRPAVDEGQRRRLGHR